MHHLDENKISQMIKDIVMDVIQLLEINFGEMSVTTGDFHVFLGMKITCLDNRTFSINMIPHLEETIEEFNEEMIEASTPARVGLLFIDETKSQVEERRRHLFYRLVHRLI